MNEELVLYYREACHLCDAMRKALHRFSDNQQALQWREVDIDRDIELIKQYDILVPVLCLGDQQICHHFFDETRLISALSGRS